MSEQVASLEPTSTNRPKVFISYSWTTPGHQEEIRQWAYRLVDDGVDVIVDFFDLREGHDKYHFMERMVTDKEITHVLVFSDKMYSERADARKAGVGTESQIISNEIYGRVAQSKFIPIACEFSQEGEPYLPVFLASKIWINFSSPELANQNWEQLIRLLYGKPAFQKPQLGKPPSYIVSEAPLRITPADAKFATLKQAFVSGSKFLDGYREDFLNTVLEPAEAIRVRSDPGVKGSSLAVKIVGDCSALRGVRNQIVDWVLLESTRLTEGFLDHLLRLLENLRELKSRPAELNTYQQEWFAAESIFVYETLLYIVAALLRRGAYDTLRELLTSKYLKPRSERWGKEQFDTFGSFLGSSEVLNLALAPEGRQFNSPAAELLKRQADRSDLPFESIVEADALLMLMALISPGVSWFPQLLNCLSNIDLPFFVRAMQHRGFTNLSKITGVNDVAALRNQIFAGYERLAFHQRSCISGISYKFAEATRLESLDTV